MRSQKFFDSRIITVWIIGSFSRIPRWPRRSWRAGRPTRDPLPRADVLLCRDALVHLSFADIRRVLRNVRASGTAYLLTTTFPGHAVNEDIVSGDWRLLNLEHAPFAFPPPRALIVEGCTEGSGRFADKSLALWRVEDL